MSTTTTKYKFDGRTIWNRTGTQWRLYNEGATHYAGRKVIGWKRTGVDAIGRDIFEPELENRVRTFAKADVTFLAPKEER